MKTFDGWAKVIQMVVVWQQDFIAIISDYFSISKC
jgi:hypothetical protein